MITLILELTPCLQQVQMTAVVNSIKPHSLVLGNSSVYDAVAVESDRPWPRPNLLDIPKTNIRLQKWISQQV